VFKVTQGYSKTIQEFQKKQFLMTQDYMKKAREHMLLSKKEKKEKKIKKKNF